MDATQLLETWFCRVWLDADDSAIDALFRPDGQAAGLLRDVEMKAEDFKVFVPALLSLLVEPSFAIERSVQAAPWLSALVRIDATAAASGAPVTVTGQVMVRYDEGRIVEAYNHFDFIGLFEQLDLLPEETMALCLSGDRIG